MKKLSLVFISLILISCGMNPQQRKAEKFLKSYTDTYVDLYYTAAKAEWKSNTYIMEGDTVTPAATERANEAMAAFTGSKENIEAAQKLLEQRDKLTPIQVKQLEAVLYAAANNPQTVPELVKERIKAETKQTELLYGFDFKLDGKSVSTNDIDNVLKEETSLKKRLAAWESSK